VLDPINLVAVTANPVAPGSHRFDAQAFCAELAQAIPDVTVLDVVSGAEAGGALTGAGRAR
jgi:hypothetical protein